MSLLSAAENEALLRDTGGVRVVKGSQRTWGHLRRAPAQALPGSDGFRGVQTAYRSVVIADGILTGIAPEEGVDELLTVDGTSYRVVEVSQPPGEPDGDMLELVLRPTA